MSLFRYTYVVEAEPRLLPREAKTALHPTLAIKNVRGEGRRPDGAKSGSLIPFPPGHRDRSAYSGTFKFQDKFSVPWKALIPKAKRFSLPFWWLLIYSSCSREIPRTTFWPQCVCAYGLPWASFLQSVMWYVGYFTDTDMPSDPPFAGWARIIYQTRWLANIPNKPKTMDIYA